MEHFIYKFPINFIMMFMLKVRIFLNLFYHLSHSLSGYFVISTF